MNDEQLKEQVWNKYFSWLIDWQDYLKNYLFYCEPCGFWHKHFCICYINKLKDKNR